MVNLDRRGFLGAGGGVLALAGAPGLARAQERIDVVVAAEAGGVPLPHIWSECAGSDRAAITLRETWRRDLDRWTAECGLKRVRFHGIFNDELGVLTPTILNRGDVKAPNFQVVDQVYDGLVERGVSPLVELSFMPSALASGKGTFGFYKGNVSPPKLIEAWADFVRQFVTHLVARYGLKTVRNWPMEVWNEPNLPFFWTGDQQTYFAMYKATALAIKGIDPSIPVGGPSSASGAWIEAFAGWCAANNAPIDFFTTHCYAGDDQKSLFGSDLGLPQSDVIGEVVKRVRRQIDASAFKGRPLWLTEWSSDSPAMIAHVIASCLPNCQMMSQWTMSNSFEELGVPNYVVKEGDMGWGMMMQQIALPTFNTYKVLNRLGDQRLEASGPALATRRKGGGRAAVVWNLADVRQPSGIPGVARTRTVNGTAKTFGVRFEGARPGQTALVSYVDQERGSPMPAWRAMGSPQYPTLAQKAELRRAAEVAPPTRMRFGRDGNLAIDLPPEGIALIEVA